ncbi:MAG: intradiol ring-cleavage dioxygenase [Oculatellaceae cyanobacterium bins.114]|nr:intradiol ring-cleavage dioxygenase [Oculatellaceae cyanobacterium bins.114]
MSKPNINRAAVVRMLKRREVLGFLGATASIGLAGCFRNPSGADRASAQAPPVTIAQATSTANCVVRPQQTEGPYFVDEALNRSDIRSDPSNGAIKSGTALQLVFQVSQVSNGACTPLKDAIVDVWHCDAEGVYSDVSDRRFNTVGQRLLRGFQVTDTTGTVQFITIYPGWYPGRTVHIHFKIRGTSPSSNYEFTSQIYFDDTLTDRVFAHSPYADRGERTVRNDQDGIFGRGGTALIVPVVQEGDRYTGRFNIGLEL